MGHREANSRHSAQRDERLRPRHWSTEFLKQNYGNVDLSVRYQGIDATDLSAFTVLKDQRKKLGWYFTYVEEPDFENDPDFEWGNARFCTSNDVVMYAKDFCFGERIQEWKDAFLPILPEFLAPGASDDIIGSIPEAARPMVLMAYMGSTGTRTPIHIDKLNSIAFNLHSFGDGSKRWWMVNHEDTPTLREFLSQNGRALHSDDCWVNPHDLRSLPIRLWEFDQKQGDMVIVPPGVPHEVFNWKGLSVALAANVINESSILLSWESEKANRDLRINSVYKFKAAVYSGILREIENAKMQEKVDRNRLVQFIPVLEDIIVEEETLEGVNVAVIKDRDAVPHRRTCDVCKVDIFNRRFHCPECGLDPDEGYDLCVQCYDKKVTSHPHKMALVERFTLDHLRAVLAEAKQLMLATTSSSSSSSSLESPATPEV